MSRNIILNNNKKNVMRHLESHLLRNVAKNEKNTSSDYTTCRTIIKYDDDKDDDNTCNENTEMHSFCLTGLFSTVTTDPPSQTIVIT